MIFLVILKNWMENLLTLTSELPRSLLLVLHFSCTDPTVPECVLWGKRTFQKNCLFICTQKIH